MPVPLFQFDAKIEQAARKASELCVTAFQGVDQTTEYNQQKMLRAFSEAGVSESHFDMAMEIEAGML